MDPPGLAIERVDGSQVVKVFSFESGIDQLSIVRIYFSHIWEIVLDELAEDAGVNLHASFLR